jgi:hypothetical protein
MKMTYDEPVYPTTFAEATAKRMMKAMDEIDQQCEEELEQLFQEYHRKVCPTLITCTGINHKMCKQCNKKMEITQK